VVSDKRNSERVWSAGWDGSVRGWELEMGQEGVVRVCHLYACERGGFELI
jgi:hypothetical protein